LLSGDSVRVSCPKALRDRVIATWFEGREYDDLIRTVSEVEGRLTSSVELERGTAIFSGTDVEPSYTWTGVGPDGRGVFDEHLAEAALAREDGQTHFGVLSPTSSWSEQSESVLVQAEVLQRETRAGYLYAPKESEAVLRSFLPLSESYESFVKSCTKEACALVLEPRFGVEAYFAGVLGGDPRDLRFEIGEPFIDSVRNIGVDKVSSNARTLLRTMALIASGKSDEVEGHEERVDAGPNSETRHCDGSPVMRAYVNNHTPNAMRLFWVRKKQVRFLNVTGHEGSPEI
jgi:hypothetical protein